MAGLWQTLLPAACLLHLSSKCLYLWCRSVFADAVVLSLLCPTSCPTLCPVAVNHASGCVLSIWVCAAVLSPRCSCFLGLSAALHRSIPCQPSWSSLFFSRPTYQKLIVFISLCHCPCLSAIMSSAPHCTCYSSSSYMYTSMSPWLELLLLLARSYPALRLLWHYHYYAYANSPQTVPVEEFRKSVIINSLNNCINTAVAKIFRVSLGVNVDFIWQMTELTSLHILVYERRSRFFSKLYH